MHRERFENAQACARALLEHFQVSAPDQIDLGRFAGHLNATVVDGEIDGAEAQLVCTPERATITLAERIKDVVARRFNLAHELGHLALCHPAPKAAELACSPKGWTSSRGLESEASAFGSELLMPLKLVPRASNVSSRELMFA